MTYWVLISDVGENRVIISQWDDKKNDYHKDIVNLKGLSSTHGIFAALCTGMCY